MKGPLTAKYASVIEQKGVKATPRLLLDGFSLAWAAFRNEKLAESLSFLVWEIFHKLGLFPRDSYLVFNENEALTLEKEDVDALDTNESIKQFFNDQGLTIVKSAQAWKNLFIDKNGEIFGCLYANDRLLYRSKDDGQTLSPLKEFPKAIQSIYITNKRVVFVSVKGTLYRSTDAGATFEKSQDLSSSESYLRRDYSMTETPDNVLIMGEYGNLPIGRGWTNMAYLYFSGDDGATWKRSDFLREQGANKHVHFVWYSKLLNKLLVTDGDNKKRMWVSDDLASSDAANPHWNLINKRHIQMGGHTAVLEHENKLLFGTDYMGGTNFILESADGHTFRKKIIPDPYRRSPIMILTQRNSNSGTEIWALLPYSTSGTKSLLMYSKDSGKSWRRFLEYGGDSHGVQLISSSNEITGVLYVSVRDVKNKTRAVYKVMNI